MTIRIVCENETGYDAGTGAFSYCDHTFTCDDSLLAKVTRCPKCQNSIRVGSSHRHVWADSGAPVADPNAVKQHARTLAKSKPGSSSNGRAGSPAETSPQAKTGNGNSHKKMGSAASATPTAAAASSRGGRSEAPLKRPAAARRESQGLDDVASSILDSAGDRPRGKAAPPTAIKCFHCGALLQEFQPKCPACLTDLTKPAGLGSNNLKVKNPVGFHRWMLVGVFSGVQPWALSLSIHVLLLLLSSVPVLLTVLLGTQEAAQIVGIGYGVFMLFYLYVAVTCHRTARNLAVPLRWWQRLIWRIPLWFARRKRWNFDPTDAHERVVLDLREKNINDANLVQVENLTLTEVLDLSGCPISDHGTRPLHFLRNLRCLVLVGTAVSAKEVGRLQKSLPNCWIWR